MEKEQARLSLHKLLRIVIKILPMLIALFYLLNTVLTYCGIDLIFISFIASVSLLPLLFMFLCSIVFQFCFYHRMFLYYILICNIITYIDYKFVLPITDFNLFMLYMIITGLTLFIILYDYQRNKKSTRKNNQ